MTEIQSPSDTKKKDFEETDVLSCFSTFSKNLIAGTAVGGGIGIYNLLIIFYVYYSWFAPYC